MKPRAWRWKYWSDDRVSLSSIDPAVAVPGRAAINVGTFHASLMEAADWIEREFTETEARKP